MIFKRQVPSVLAFLILDFQFFHFVWSFFPSYKGFSEQGPIIFPQF